jgi:hypothetical protein
MWIRLRPYLQGEDAHNQGISPAQTSYILMTEKKTQTQSGRGLHLPPHPQFHLKKERDPISRTLLLLEQ